MFVISTLIQGLMFLKYVRSFGVSRVRQPAIRRRIGIGISVRHLSSRKSAIDQECRVEQMRLESLEELDKIVDMYKGLSSSPQIFKTKEQVASFLENIDTVLFDCDGVLYRSPDPISGAKDAIESLMKRNKQVFFVTNNAGSNRIQLKEKLCNILQFNDDNILTEEMMVGSSYSCAQYLRRNILNTKGSCKVFVIGSEGLCEEIRQIDDDVQAYNANNEMNPSMSREELAEYDFTTLHPVDAVVVGHDTEFNFRKLSIATILLQWNPDATLVATNEDSFDLVGVDSRRIPGNGSLVRSIEYASGRKAVNVGKPSKILIDLLVAEFGIDPSRSLIVGDRLDTDIRLGVETGNNMSSALVLTGVTTSETLQRIGTNGSEEEPLPTVIIPHVGLMK